MIEHVWQLLQDFLDFAGGKFSWRDAIDIGLVTFAIYWLLLLIRGTRAVQETRLRLQPTRCARPGLSLMTTETQKHSRGCASPCDLRGPCGQCHSGAHGH